MVALSWGILPHVTHGSFDDEHDRLAPIDGESFADRLSRFMPTDGSIIKDASDEYKQLRVALDGLRERLEAAIALDEQKQTSIFQELGQFFKRGLEYPADRQRFQADIDQLKAQAKADMQALEDLLKPAFDNLDVPDELADDRAKWGTVSTALREVARDLPGLAQVDGWSGPAAREYSTMTGVQAQAALEFAQMARTMESTLTSAQMVNEAVLGTIYAYVEGARVTASVFPASSDDRFFVNTAHVDTTIRQCIANVKEALTMADAEVAASAKQIRDIAAAPVILQSRWPSGTDLAGIEAARFSYDPEEPTLTPDEPSKPVSDTESVSREG